MQGYNCIMIFSLDGEKLLFCKRTKNPYKGLYNFVGGKIEKHPLEWMSVNENYFDCRRFAGEGNIGHMVEQVKTYGVGKNNLSV